jgi:hypothetical protein
LIFCRYRSLVVPSGTLGPVHIKLHCGLHDAVQLIDVIVSPSVTVYIVVGGDRVTYSGPSTMNRNNNISFRNYKNDKDSLRFRKRAMVRKLNIFMDI